MENNYLVAFHGMERLFDQVERSITAFNRNAYTKEFKEFYNAQLPVLQALENGYVSAIDKETYYDNMADALVNAAAKYLEGFTKKRALENERININLMMIAYICPSILKFNGSGAQAFVDLALEKWKEQFPESNISAATYEDIEAGFHRKWCYITTAVCESSGKADNCYELTLLRDYRDTYLAGLENGRELIREYYDVAPTIVKHINKSSEKDSVYQGIYDEYIQPCIHMIEEGKLSECKDLYTDMVHDLHDRYFYMN